VILEENYLALRTLVAFVLGGFVTHAVMLWRTRRTNYCQVCGASRSLILQISSILPIPSDPNNKDYEEIKRERETMERWALLGYELSVLKGKGVIDSQSGKIHLEELGLLVGDEWDKMVAGDRHTTVWYWIQQKAMHLADQGIIKSEHRLQLLCQAVRVMRDRANDLMSCTDRDIPNGYSFVVGFLINLNLISRSLFKGVQWSTWFFESSGKVYLTSPAMWTDLILNAAIFISYIMLYEIAMTLYNPFMERPETDDVPHKAISAGIRNLGNSLGEGKDTRPSTMFWMKSQADEYKRLGLRHRPQETRNSLLSHSALNEVLQLDTNVTAAPRMRVLEGLKAWKSTRT